MSQLVLTAETLAGTPAAGTTEYNGTIQTFTPLGTQRGVVPNEQFFVLNAGLAGTQVLTAQNILGVGVTLSASTQYEFEIVVLLTKTAGTTSHTISTSFGGTATINNILYQITANSATTSPALISTLGFLNGTAIVATSTTVSGTIATATIFSSIIIKGTVSINAGGTFIPQYTLSAAPGGAYTTAAGSYMKIKPIGVSGANVSVGAWS